MSGRWWRERAELLAPAIGLLALFGGWEAYVRVADVSPLTLPAPSRIVGHLLDEPAFYLRNGWVTIAEALAGFTIALAVALLVATVMAHWRFAERATMPVIVLIQSTPVAVLVDELRRHRRQAATVEQVEKERLENVVAVVAEDDGLAAVLTCDPIEDAAAQAGTQRAVGPVGRHLVGHDRIRVLGLDVVGNAVAF